MTIRQMTMPQAAILLLAASLAPAWAGTHSTRAERDATRQLNLEQAQQAQARNAAAMPAPAVTDAAAHMADNTPPAAAPTIPVQTGVAAPLTAPPAP